MTSKTSLNHFAERMPVGTRVQWTREMYRVPFRNRPTDHGTVVEFADERGDFLRVRDDATGKIVTGPAACFRVSA